MNKYVIYFWFSSVGWLLRSLFSADVECECYKYDEYGNRKPPIIINADNIK